MITKYEINRGYSTYLNLYINKKLMGWYFIHTQQFRCNICRPGWFNDTYKFARLHIIHHYLKDDI